MVVMEGFDHLLNWKLKRGSHDLPGPDGGTCINEAALVAAGFEYRAIYAAEHMPECFSRPICRLAMWLNDHADDKERQRLLPYVTRLACADTPEIELKRKAYIRQHGCSWLWCSWLFGPTFETGLQVLEGALAIGRQADLFGPDEVQIRMDAVRADSPLLSEKPFFSKVKSWMT
jgi:hypothetical protein